MRQRTHYWIDVLSDETQQIWPDLSVPFHTQQCSRCATLRRWKAVRWEYRAEGGWQACEEPACEAARAPVQAT